MIAVGTELCHYICQLIVLNKIIIYLFRRIEYYSKSILDVTYFESI